MNEISQGKEKLKKLLDTLNIKKIVYVDDYNYDINVEKIIVSSKRNIILETYFPKILLIGEESIENEELIKQWNDIPFETKIKIKDILNVEENSLSSIDSIIIPVFKEIIPEKFLISLSPEEWEKRKKKLLIDNKTTLFLFDQDLKRNERGEDGITIIKDISENIEVICGLFTQKVQKDNCLLYRDTMCKVHGIRKDVFFVIPKEEANNNPLFFVYLLKLTILGRDFMRFKEYTNNIIKEVNENVEQKIDRIGIEDFDQIIFKTPLKEGSWEPDMFFRIYSSYQRQDFINLATSKNELKTAISKIREVSDIQTKPISFLIPSEAWKIQHQELYDDADSINKNHLPIEIGDIFEKTNKESINKYILLTQPCDLMIRTDGKRSRDNNRFALIKIKKLIEEKRNKNTAYEQELWYYGISENDRWIINFKDINWVKDYILDLCSYNDDGLSRYYSIFKSNNYFRPSLINHYSKIDSQISEGMKERKKIIDGIRGEKELNLNNIERNIYESKFNDDLFTAKYVKKKNNFILTYNCKRTGRLIYERALGLLAEFYSVMQRPAYPPDYGQEE